MKNKRLQTYQIVIFTLLLFSCSTSPNKSVALKGQINLFGLDDHSGAIVALYAPTPLDNSIVNLNKSFENVGVQISQETEFDHRLQKPIKMAVSDVSGNFQLENISPDRYNLAILKEGFSIRYFEIQLDRFIDLEEILIHQIINMPQTISESVVFRHGMQYHFPQSTIILAPVTIETGSILTVEINKKIDFYNNIEIKKTANHVSQNHVFNLHAEYWWLTSAFSMDSTVDISIEPSYYFDKINILSPEQIDLSHAKVTFMSAGINITAPFAIISSSYFDLNNTALVINGGSVNIHNILHKGSYNRSIYFDSKQDIAEEQILYMNNISKNNLISLYCNLMGLEMKNNFMISNGTGVYVWDGFLLADQNTFIANHTNIENLGSVATIQNNEFRESQYVDIIFGESRSKKADGVVNFNNFFGTTNFYFRMSTINSLIGVVSDIDCTNNYFINNNIDHQIWDKHDNINLQYEFIYIPKSIHPN